MIASVDDSSGQEIARVTLHGKSRKDRTVVVRADLVRRIRAAFDLRRYLFGHNGQAYTREYVSIFIRRLSARVIRKTVAAHALRHFWFTNRLHEDPGLLKEISSYGGHASTSTTVDLYLHGRFKARDGSMTTAWQGQVGRVLPDDGLRRHGVMAAEDTRAGLNRLIDDIKQWYIYWRALNPRKRGGSNDWHRFGSYKVRLTFYSNPTLGPTYGSFGGNLILITYVGRGRRFLFGDPVLRIPTGLDDPRRLKDMSIYLIESESRLRAFHEYLGLPDSLEILKESEIQ
jgi:hypothetical protein